MTSLSKWLIASLIAVAFVFGWSYYSGAFAQEGCQTTQMVQEEVLSVIPDAKFLTLEGDRSVSFTEVVFTAFPGAPANVADVSFVYLSNGGDMTMATFHSADGCTVASITLPTPIILEIANSLNGS